MVVRVGQVNMWSDLSKDPNWIENRNMEMFIVELFLNSPWCLPCPSLTHKTFNLDQSDYLTKIRKPLIGQLTKIH